MSQRLPALPNLDYLKKQAKNALRVSRHRFSRWRLADAQHAIARGYGFRSWPDLKLHVESVRPRQRRVPPAGRSNQPDPTAASLRGAPRDNRRASRGRTIHPIGGTWATHLKASPERRAGALTGDVLVEFEVTNDVVTLTQIVIDPSGRESAMKMVIQTDGQDHPVQTADGLMLQATWINPRTLETFAKRGDVVVSKGTYEVSPDGQSLVVSTAEERLVFARV
jgi:hypothetical protein